MDHRSLRIGDLELFADLARLRSVRAAARRRGFHPSRVSKTLDRLEQKLSTTLFERTGSGLVLTTEGIEFLEIATEVLRVAEPLERRQELREAESTLLSIGSVSFLIRTLLAARMNCAHSLTARHRLRLIEIPPDRIADAGIARVFDAALHLSELAWPDTWFTEQVGHLRWGLYAGADHPMESVTDEEQVRKHPFVLPTYWQDGVYAAGSDHCPLPMDQRIRGHEVSSADIALEIISSSRQLAFLPTAVTNAAIEEKRVREVHVREWSPITRPIYLSVHSDAVRKSVANQLKEWIGAGLVELG